jgi:hypothetical protein
MNSWMKHGVPPNSIRTQPSTNLEQIEFLDITGERSEADLGNNRRRRKVPFFSRASCLCGDFRVIVRIMPVHRALNIESTVSPLCYVNALDQPGKVGPTFPSGISPSDQPDSH